MSVASSFIKTCEMSYWTN